MENTNNIVLRFKKVFLGKTSGFENTQERNFEKAHLKAYLAGRKWFHYGFIEEPNGLISRGQFLVKYDYVKIPLETPESRGAKRFIKNNPLMIAN